jgi:hypothetical protein
MNDLRDCTARQCSLDAAWGMTAKPPPQLNASLLRTPVLRLDPPTACTLHLSAGLNVVPAHLRTLRSVGTMTARPVVRPRFFPYNICGLLSNDTQPRTPSQGFDPSARWTLTARFSSLSSPKCRLIWDLSWEGPRGRKEAGFWRPPSSTLKRDCVLRVQATDQSNVNLSSSSDDFMLFLHSLFKGLFTFPSQYLCAIGISPIFKS